MARPGQRQTGARRSAPRKQRRVRHRGDVVPVLARTRKSLRIDRRTYKATISIDILTIPISP